MTFSWLKTNVVVVVAVVAAAALNLCSRWIPQLLRQNVNIGHNHDSSLTVLCYEPNRLMHAWQKPTCVPLYAYAHEDLTC